MLILFCVYTFLVAMVDFKPIGPGGSEVGFATVNRFFQQHLAYNDLFYVLSKILGYVCFIIPGINVAVAIRDIIRKKNILKIGPDVLGSFVIYVLLGLAYILFEVVVLNYRPMLMDGELEASYPSSHSMLGMTVYLTAALQLNFRDRNRERRVRNQRILLALGILTVLTRFLSGVHWFTDILGGVLLGLTLVALYVPLVRAIGKLFYHDKKKKPVRRPQNGAGKGQGHGQGHARKPRPDRVEAEKANAATAANAANAASPAPAQKEEETLKAASPAKEKGKEAARAEEEKLAAAPEEKAKGAGPAPAGKKPAAADPAQEVKAEVQKTEAEITDAEAAKAE